MAPRVIFLFLSLIFLYLSTTSHSFVEPKVQAFLHPIRKDEATNSYFIPLSTGTNSDYVPSLNLLIDLNGAAPLLRPCATAAKSTSYHSIKCGSTRCNYVNPNFSCPNNTTKKPTCRKYVSTSFSDKPVNVNLLRDTFALLYTPNGVYHMDSEKISTLTLTCTDDTTALKPIPSAFNGAIGLANTDFSIPSQLASMYKFPLKISLCLPSTKGMKSYSGNLWIGGGPFYYLPYLKDVSKSFASTPLIGNDKSGEYLIDVKSIQIGGKTIPILRGTTKICTLAPYTVLHTSIYKALVATFAGKAKMVKAPAVKPFGSCFRSNGGRGVPVIELVLRGGAKWRIHGWNSLVKVNKDVVCLGFVDGGLNPRNLILIGGFQLEDNLVEFDLKASKFYFSSSLLLHNTSCSVDRFFARRGEVRSRDNRKTNKSKDVFVSKQSVEELYPPAGKEDGSLRFPWAAKMNPSLRNLYRTTTPTYMADGAPKVGRHMKPTQKVQEMQWIDVGRKNRGHGGRGRGR